MYAQNWTGPPVESNYHDENAGHKKEKTKVNNNGDYNITDTFEISNLKQRLKKIQISIHLNMLSTSLRNAKV